VRETELWRRLDSHVGAGYAKSWAAQVALTALDSRTVLEALADGVPTRAVWDAVWVALELPDSER